MLWPTTGKHKHKTKATSTQSNFASNPGTLSTKIHVKSKIKWNYFQIWSLSLISGHRTVTSVTDNQTSSVLQGKTQKHSHKCVRRRMCHFTVSIGGVLEGLVLLFTQEVRKKLQTGWDLHQGREKKPLLLCLESKVAFKAEWLQCMCRKLGIKLQRGDACWQLSKTS